MCSLNVPVAGAVAERAWELRSRLLGFEELRDRHTLVVKRLEATEPEEFARLERAVHETVRGTPPFEVSATGIEVFDSPPAGPGPVVYIAVESQGLVELHRDLVDAFGAVPEIEGANYVPHITLARGGERSLAAGVASVEISPITWTANRLVFWDARRGLPTGEIGLPA